MIYNEVREICMGHLKIDLSARIEEETDPATQAITKTTYGKASLFWDNQLIGDSPEVEMSQTVTLPSAGGMSGRAGLY